MYKSQDKATSSRSLEQTDSFLKFKLSDEYSLKYGSERMNYYIRFIRYTIRNYEPQIFLYRVERKITAD